MAFSLFRILKGLRITQENTLTPKEIEIIPGGTAGTKTTITTSQTVNRTLTLPDNDAPLIDSSSAQTLTNKTIDADLNTITNIDNGNIKAAAAIEVDKLEALTASRAVQTDASGFIEPSAVTSTELGYVSGVTSAIQTQLNAKANDNAVVHLAGSETVTGSKTFTAAQIFENILRGDVLDDAVTTGANAALPAPAKMVVRATNASLTSIETITSPVSDQFFVLVNDTGDTVTILNSTTPSANEILTGTGVDLALLNNGSLWLYYDSTETKWRVIGGSGGGSSFADDLFQIYDDGDITKIAKFQVSGITTGTTRTFTLPDANTTLVGTDATQTLTNKTLATASNNVTATASRAAQFNGSGNLEASAVTSTELGHVAGVTSAIQTQLNAKATTALDNLASTAVNVDIDPGVDATRDLGNASARWNEIHVNNTNTLTVGRASNLLQMTGNALDLNDAPLLDVDRVALLNKSGDPATPSSGYTSLYSKNSDKKLYIKDDAGAVYKLGIANDDVINYIDNPDAENNTSGWATYADAAGAAPVDGTGGAPTVTLTRTTTLPLRGLGSFLFTKDAANRQGEGVSYDFIIDRADRFRVLNVSFDYEIVAGSTYSGGSSSTDSDLVVYVYDTVSSVMTQLSPYKLDGAVIGQRYTFNGEFQTGANPDYRLIIHTATTSASAYSVKLDNVVVSPNIKTLGSLTTSFVNSGPVTISAVTTPPTKGTIVTDRMLWRRIGDSMEIHMEFNQSTGTAAGSGNYLFRIPSGYVIDTNKVTPYTGSSNSDQTNILGVFDGGNASTSVSGEVIAYDTQYVRFLAWNGTTNVFIGSANIPASAAVRYNARFTVPIVGWESNVLASSDASTRVVAARYKTDAGPTGGTAAPFDYATKVFDTHNAVTVGAAWKFTAPVSGYYRCSVSAFLNAGGALLSLYKNGVLYAGITAINSSNTVSGTHLIDLNAGDYVDFRPGSTVALSATADINSIDIERVSGPSQIMATETIAAAYSGGDGKSSSTSQPIDYATRRIDTHNAVTTGAAWKFTAPSKGIYDVSVSGNITASSTGISIYKNGVIEVSVLVFDANQTVGASQLVSLNAGDYVDIRSSGSVTTGGNSNVISIKRIGL